MAIGIITDPDLTVIREEAQRCKHASGYPNVLPVLDVDNYRNQVVIVSEYASGGDLQGWLNDMEGLRPRSKLRSGWSAEFWQGLEHLHSIAGAGMSLIPAGTFTMGSVETKDDSGKAKKLITPTSIQRS